jgi:membrane fusion protein (multidrug efflux system)
MGAMVWVVNAQNKAEMRPVTLGQTIENDVVVPSGLKAGERVIVEGVIKVKPGVDVKAEPYTAPLANAASQAGKPAQAGAAARSGTAPEASAPAKP